MLFSHSGDHLCSPPAVLLGVGFLLCLFTGGLLLCFSHFLWGKVSDLSAGPLLSVGCDDSLFVFQRLLTLGVAHWLRRWVLWSATCPASGSGLSPAHCWPSCLSSHLFDSSHEDQLLASPPFSSGLLASHPLWCLLVFSLLLIVLFFLWWGGSPCPGDYAGLSQGWLGEYCVMLGAHLLVCRMSPKQVWSQYLARGSPPVFSV
jgi:hypothetical protein